MPDSSTDAFLQGQGIPVDPRSIEAELIRLWGPAAERLGGPDLEHPTVTRVVLANLVVGTRPADAADTAFQRFGCNDGKPIPLSPLHSEPYGRALLVALERRLGIGGPREKMPPEQVFTAGARPADPALLNGLPGREVTVPRTDADGFPIGGVRFSAADLPLGSPVPPAVAPVSTASITAVCGNYGGWQPYTADELRRRYGSLDDYVSAYDARVTRLIASGLLLERDRGLLLDRASEEWSKAPTGS